MASAREWVDKAWPHHTERNELFMHMDYTDELKRDGAEGKSLISKDYTHYTVPMYLPFYKRQNSRASFLSGTDTAHGPKKHSCVQRFKA